VRKRGAFGADEPSRQARCTAEERPRDFTWDELQRLLEGLGYVEARSGRTGGSRRRFVHPTAPVITLHKPHPGNIVKMYVIDDVLRVLIEEDLI
jgi:predicted RNA binding protein YcfA (HicA-like mRNA interferase family)